MCFSDDSDGLVSGSDKGQSEEDEWTSSGCGRAETKPKQRRRPPQSAPRRKAATITTNHRVQTIPKPKQQQLMLPIADDVDSDVESLHSATAEISKKANSVYDVIVTSSSDNEVIETDKEEAVEVEVDLSAIPGLGGGGMLPLPPSMRKTYTLSTVPTDNPATSAIDAYQQYINSLPVQGQGQPGDPVEEITLDD